MLALIVIAFLIIIWMLLLLNVKSKGLGRILLDEPFTVVFIVGMTVLVILLVLVPLIEIGIGNFIVDYYLDKPVKI